MEEVLVIDQKIELDGVAAASSPDRYSLYTIYLPLNDNNGSPMEPKRLGWALDNLVQRFGGLTRHQPGVGLWLGLPIRSFGIVFCLCWW